MQKEGEEVIMPLYLFRLPCRPDEDEGRLQEFELRMDEVPNYGEEVSLYRSVHMDGGAPLERYWHVGAPNIDPVEPDCCEVFFSAVRVYSRRPSSFRIDMRSLGVV